MKNATVLAKVFGTWKNIAKKLPEPTRTTKVDKSGQANRKIFYGLS
jgi:hypothetical protein